MGDLPTMQQRIGDELAKCMRPGWSDWVERIAQGQVDEALARLVFYTPPAEFGGVLGGVQREIQARFPSIGPEAQEALLHFEADLAKWLRSFLPRWNLLADDRSRQGAPTAADLAATAEVAERLALDMAADAPKASAALLGYWRQESAPRMKAEGVADPWAAADDWVGASLSEYLTNFSGAVTRSNLRQIAELRAAGRTLTEVSNDYAAFLPYAMFLGASFVTCNPPLVDLAWVADPSRWNAVADELIAASPGAPADDLARRMTLEVVFSNMRLLRPVFLLTRGKMGYVSLQVNPKRHGDSAAMIADAERIYAELREKLGGGVPNVVFKLPGTQAGLDACRGLTRQGIGVNITVNFALFQHLPFALAIQQGNALLCTLSHMSGRLAFPVRDELLARLPELSRRGLDERQIREAAAWSGVAVLKRLMRLLRERGLDLSRVKPLIASMRIYPREVHPGLPSEIPDITEAIGVGILTVFPNVRRAFDRAAGIALEPNRVDSPVPAPVLGVLAHSQIFRQAYWVGDSSWGTDDPDLRPERPLRLEDAAEVAEWTPVSNTLAEFCKAYDVFVERLEGRRRLAALRAAAGFGQAAEVGEATLRKALEHFDQPTLLATLRVLIETPSDPRIGRAANETGPASSCGQDPEVAELFQRVKQIHSAGDP